MASSSFKGGHLCLLGGGRRAGGRCIELVHVRTRGGSIRLPALPAFLPWKTPANHTHAVGWVPKYTFVCWVPISRQPRGRTEGLWGFVRLSPLSSKSKAGRVARYSATRPPCLPVLENPRQPHPCGRVGSQVHFRVLGADFQVAQGSY